MSDNDGRDRHTLTLLIQLFGREVLDRLAGAGYDDATAIAAAGPERLAAMSGVSLPLAHRIVAVVEEARGSSPGTRPGPPPEVSRGRREPRRRKAPPLRAAPEIPESRIEAAPSSEDSGDADAFVDDVALVTWMGFTSRTPSGRLSFSVADGILDPVRPEPPAAKEPEAIPGISVPATGALTRAPRGPGSAGKTTPDEPPRRTLPGSFWTFGRPAGAPVTRADGKQTPPDPPTPQGGTTPTRRRDRDDH